MMLRVLMILDWYVDNGTDEQVAIVSRVMDFISQHEMFKKHNKVIVIDIDFLNTKGGGCVEVERGQFEIEINKRYCEKTIEKILIHEMIHVEQYVSGRLTQTQWMGKPQPQVPYMEQPWEIEAYKLESELYNAMAA